MTTKEKSIDAPPTDKYVIPVDIRCSIPSTSLYVLLQTLQRFKGRYIEFCDDPDTAKEIKMLCFKVSTMNIDVDTFIDGLKNYETLGELKFYEVIRLLAESIDDESIQEMIDFINSLKC